MTYRWVDEEPGGSWWETVETIAVQLRCEYCGALPDERCVTSSGRPADRLHDARTAPVQNANANGYSEGERDARSRSAS